MRFDERQIGDNRLLLVTPTLADDTQLGGQRRAAALGTDHQPGVEATAVERQSLCHAADRQPLNLTRSQPVDVGTSQLLVQQRQQRLVFYHVAKRGELTVGGGQVGNTARAALTDMNGFNGSAERFDLLPKTKRDK